MISVSESSPAAMWERAFVLLHDKGYSVPENGFYKNECAALEVLDTSPHSVRYSPHCPTPEERIAAISRYLVAGGDERGVDHAWTKIYRNRIFETPNQIDRIVSLLEDWPDCPRAQISLWNPDRDYVRYNAAPCLQILWFKIINRRLDLHVHMRTTDCYGKLLMNVNEFLELQHHVGTRLGLPAGVYCQFVDSLHFHTKDTDAVDRLAVAIKEAARPGRTKRSS